ncbi:MAG: hypothetical protein HQM13_12130 [SAR324 cluster bacterium]|nr:hypothetical protein [SAR324 cluster bacterium]
MQISFFQTRSPYRTKFFFLLLVVSTSASCSYHFRDAQELENKKRLEEASIEYRLAFIEDSDNKEAEAALKRTNILVSEQNLNRYTDYLNKKEFKKAYRRLETSIIQNPSFAKAQTEQAHWLKVLISGKVKLEFDRLQANIRLASQMQLQIVINTPSGKTLTADISNETGIFFVEDLLYKYSLKELPHYTINAIGLRLKRVTPGQRTKEEFRKFVNFRGLIPDQTVGSLQTNSSAPTQTVLEHRSQLLAPRSSLPEPWFPSRLIRYSIALKGSEIEVTSSERTDFMPSTLYLNHEQQRAFVDFGVYQLALDQDSRLWSLKKAPYLSKSDDYFYQFSQNLALYPYFFYRDGVYQYTAKNNSLTN